MSVRVTCPGCGCTGDIEAFLVEDEAKRLAARLAVVEPALGRASLAYLRLFKPAASSMRLARAGRVLDELFALVETGTVCRDERTNVRRSTTPALWAAGIEQLLASPPAGLPLTNHAYLRAVVHTLAEEKGATQFTAKPTPARVGPSPIAADEDPLRNAVRYADQMMEIGGWDEAQRDAYIAEQRAKIEGKS